MSVTSHLPVTCTSLTCPHYKSCCQLPSSCYYSSENKIDIVIVGQGAGWQEERDKKPWVGKAGELLRNILREIRLTNPLGICLTNTVRCRPTEIVGGKTTDRAPTKEELDNCLLYLYRDIAKLKPEVVLLMGSSAANSFNFEGSVTSLRGREQAVSILDTTYPAIITFHPAGVLRIPSSGRQMRLDIEKVFKIAKEMKELPF